VHRQHWVLDVDIRKYFDSISHSHLREILDQRVTDGVVRRMIDKWLNAGVLEAGTLHFATEGTPQGGVISPMLSNIFLHYVLDAWFESEVKPRLKGKATLVRFADDFVMTFETYQDAKRVMEVLGKRLGRFGLTLHPDKTHFIDFRPQRHGGMPQTARPTLSTSLASPTLGQSRGRARMWCGKPRLKAGLPARWPRSRIGAGPIGTCLPANSAPG